jgi:hypothetical protein
VVKRVAGFGLLLKQYGKIPQAVDSYSLEEISWRRFYPEKRHAD